MKEKNKSARDTDIVIPHSPKNSIRGKNWMQHKKRHLPRTRQPSIYHVFLKSVALEGCRKEIFSSTTKFTKIMVKEEGSLEAAGRASRGRWVLFF
jgi:hypothetical protein